MVDPVQLPDTSVPPVQTTNSHPQVAQTSLKGANKTCLIIVFSVLGCLIVGGIILAVLFAFVFKASSEVAKKIAEDVKITSTSDSSSVTFGDKDNQVNISSDKKLPADFPSFIPVYPGTTVEGSSSTKADGKVSYIVNLSSSDSYSKVYDYYTSQLSQGWTNYGATDNTLNGKQAGLLGGEKNGMSLSVTVSKDDNGKTVIGLIVGPKTSD